MTGKIILDDGKYTVVNGLSEGGKLYAYRYDAPWRDLSGDKLILAMFHEIEKLQVEVKDYKRIADGYAKDIQDAHKRWLSLQGEVQRLRAALQSLPDKIMQIDSFADIEELTFPLEKPTAEEQTEWFIDFCKQLRMHIQGVIDDTIEALSTTPTGENQVSDEIVNEYDETKQWRTIR